MTLALVPGMILLTLCAFTVQHVAGDKPNPFSRILITGCVLGIVGLLYTAYRINR